MANQRPDESHDVQLPGYNLFEARYATVVKQHEWCDAPLARFRKKECPLRLSLQFTTINFQDSCQQAAKLVGRKNVLTVRFRSEQRSQTMDISSSANVTFYTMIQCDSTNQNASTGSFIQALTLLVQ